jgi:three-Cys-motif partner protein
MVALTDYAGREQSYVKHVFLERYLERLVHKTASVYPHIVFVDGFAGPWQSANEKFEDTSFGIALNALRRARASWKERGRDVRMSAFLVERDAEAYKKLAQVPSKYPDVAIKTYPADFLTILPKILKDIPGDAFAFFLIDPKGWRIPLNTLAPMLARPHSEVIFNFMFDFINRAASIKEPNVVTGLNELIPHGDWRAALDTAENSRPGGLSSEERKAILVEAFASNLAHFGSYKYVAETTVLRPVKDRPLYCLFYATRHEKGIEVFRDCQAEALKEQSKTRAATKVKHAEAKTGQAEIFQSLHDMGPDDLTAFQEGERRAAEATLLNLTPQQPASIRYDNLWPQVLARHVVRRTHVNAIAA